MSSIERELNTYLFYEFGFDAEADESHVSDSWPFRLRRVAAMGEEPVFEFDADEPFFALVVGGLTFFPKAGMDASDLHLQLAGSRWIAARDPIGLDVSSPGDPSIPPGVERRRVIQDLGLSVLPHRGVQILEGLFLRSERRYLGLFRAADEPEAIVGGLPRAISVPFPKASSLRRLAWGVGRWLEDEGATQSAG